MQCERLIKLAKSWYISVRDETMAPARMVAFMENHAAECPICQKDPDIHDEIAKIKEVILPESKIPKAVRLQNEQAEEAAQAKKAAEENASGNDDEDEVYDDDGESEGSEPDLNGEGEGEIE